MKRGKNNNKTKSNSVTISSVTNELKDSFIMIEYDNSQPLTKYTKILLHRFMSVLNGYIGARTNLNYRIQPVKDFRITIPIYIYTNEDKQLAPFELIQKRIDTLTDALEHIEWSRYTNLQEQWIMQSLLVSGIDVSSSFVLSTDVNPLSNFNNIENEPIHINTPTYKKLDIKRVRYSDDSTITYLSSPYLTDYGMFANLSITFDEMGMSFNALHLYEHIMTYAWKDANTDKTKLINGATWPNGICSVFAVTQDLNAMKEYAALYIKFYLESRAEHFWENESNFDGLKLETQRTISETRDERTLSSLCRSDFHAYDYKYNTKIFEYWSQRPFDILISGPLPISELSMNENVINAFMKKNKPRNIPRPPNIKYKSLPFDVLRMKVVHQFRVLKADTEEVKKSLLFPSPDNKALYGIDSKIVSDNEDLTPYNCILHVLCYMNRLFTDEDLTKFLKRFIIPFSGTFFSETSLSSKFAGDYLFEPNDADMDVSLFEPYDAREEIKSFTDEQEDGTVTKRKRKHPRRKQKSTKNVKTIEDTGSETKSDPSTNTVNESASE